MTYEKSIFRVKRCRYGDMAYLVHDRFLGRSLELYGEFSEEEVILFRHLVKPGDTVVEIGANIGAHTVPLGQMVGSQGQVLAFEPLRMIYYVLCTNIALNGLTNVICHQAAVAQTSGKIQVPEMDWSQDASFGSLGLEDAYRGATCEVPVLRVDDLHFSRCDFIKIDVEGMEKRVLEGAVDTIAEFQPFLYVEDDRPEKSPELHEFLRSLGYEVLYHRPSLFAADNFAKNAINIFPDLVSCNVLCRHRQSAIAFDGEQVLTSRNARIPFARGCIAHGNLLFEEGLLDEAAARFRQAVRWQPDSDDAYHDLGVALERQGQLEEAAASYERALEIQPQRADTLNGLCNVGDLLDASHNVNAAMACYQRVLHFQPNYGRAHNNLGTILFRQGRLREAEACFREALRLNNPEAARNLAVVRSVPEKEAT